jgi:hypothetical protein
VITRLDRLGRSLPHLLEVSADLRERDVDLIVLQQQIDTSTAAGRMFFAVLGAVGEFERDLLSERTRDGLRAARARGRTGGRKSKLKPAHVQLARQMRDELDDDGRRRHTVQDIADKLDVSRGTIHRALKAPPPSLDRRGCRTASIGRLLLGESKRRPSAGFFPRGVGLSGGREFVGASVRRHFGPSPGIELRKVNTRVPVNRFTSANNGVTYTISRSTRSTCRYSVTIV